VDCATNHVLDWELAESENARATARLIKRTCQTYGIFDRLYTDNGSAFAGHLVAGGAVHRFRNSGNKMEGVKPLGICHHLGIRLHFALPANGQAKTAERTFASLSRVIDDRPEFNGAHAGHAPGAAPDASIVPVHLDVALAVLTREEHRHNNEAGRRGQGMRGRSYQDAFTAGIALRMRRQPSARQLYLAGLIYTPVKVDRWGRVTINTWTYGDSDTQETLLPYHKSGQAILLGRDPDDFSAPALAWNEANALICEGIMPVSRGAYDSVDGIRDAARNRKAASDAVKAAATANAYGAEAELTAIMAAIPTPEGTKMPPEAVVAGRFNGALRLQKRKPALANAAPAVPDEFLKIMDAHLAEIAAGRKPKLA
jgi:putative transposase